MTATQINKTKDQPFIKWAPLTGIPIERRLQTAAVCFWIFSLASSVIIYLYSLSYLVLLPFHIVYLTYIFLDNCSEKGGRRSEWFRQLPVWKYVAAYFPMTLKKEAELDPSKNYLFGFHPHGIIGLSAVTNFATEGNEISKVFPGVKASLLTLASNFKLPLYREMILAMGMASVSRNSIEHILSSGPGKSVVVVVGGAVESLDARPGTIDLTLKQRLGFIKMAIRCKADLVPVFSFGENDVYEQVDNAPGTLVWKIQKEMKKVLGFTIPLFYARGIFNYNFGLVPYRRPIVTVVGKPIPVPKLEEGQTEPTKEQLLETQEIYIQEVEAIYNRYKDVYAKDRKHDLRIIR